MPSALRAQTHKVAMYDERLKMKRDTQQKAVFFLFTFRRSFYIMPLPSKDNHQKPITNTDFIAISWLDIVKELSLKHNNPRALLKTSGVNALGSPNPGI